jgi:hypothetical protein
VEVLTSDEGKHLLNNNSGGVTCLNENQHTYGSATSDTHHASSNTSDIHSHGYLDISNRKLSIPESLFKHEEAKYFRKDESTHEEGEPQQDTPTKFSLNSKNDDILAHPLQGIN